MNNIKNYGPRHGVYDDGLNVFSFEIKAELPSDETLVTTDYKNTYYKFLQENATLRLGEYSVAPYGKEHNLFPLELRDIVGQNRLLPEILEKQIRYMWGKGPYLYREDIKDDKVVRIPVKDPKIEAWLNSWKERGLKHDYREYLQWVIREFYYTEGFFTQYRMSASRRINGSLPVAGLEYISTNMARLASDLPVLQLTTLTEDLFKYVAVGNWLLTDINKFKIFRRFDESNPLADPSPVNYTRNFSFGEELYSFPGWYYGLREWLITSNLNPKYINSYLKNSLNAKIHVLIPERFLNKKREMLQSLCKQNKELQVAGRQLIEKYNGVDLDTEYKESMVSDLINYELQKVSTMMSGEGKNQGKFFSSIKYIEGSQISEWEFKEIPGKYKEFIESIISLDERIDTILPAGKGVDPSLSNVSKEGVISKSGSDLLYNYIIYIDTLSLPESICTYDINKAIQINFPYVRESGVKLGFYHNIPARQEETTPSNRLINTATK